MPIRFACPHCRQKLTVSVRKAGNQADCPRCKQNLTIPTPPPQPAVERKEPALAAAVAGATAAQTEVDVPPQPQPAVTDDHQAAEGAATSPTGVPEAIEQPDAQGPGVFGGQHVCQMDTPVLPKTPDPLLTAAQTESAYFTPDEGGFEGLELIYDTDAERDEPAAPPVHGDLVAVPRYVIYIQGGLIAVVALAAFAIGLLAGGTMLPQNNGPRAPQAAVIRGTVTYSTAGRSLPDEGAVAVVIPEGAERPDEKAPIAGLRPTDSVPATSHRGLAILRDLGGGYARADAAGQFMIELPDRGRYLVLVISREKRSRSAGEISTADILKLGPYLDNAADLLADRRYQLTAETIRGERRIEVAFE